MCKQNISHSPFASMVFPVPGGLINRFRFIQVHTTKTFTPSAEDRHTHPYSKIPFGGETSPDSLMNKSGRSNGSTTRS